MSDFDLDEGAILSKVSKYELDRGGKFGRIFIDIHEVISAEKRGEYFAIPNLAVAAAREQFIAVGETEEDALKKCLKLIKGVDAEEIIAAQK